MTATEAETPEEEVTESTGDDHLRSLIREELSAALDGIGLAGSDSSPPEEPPAEPVRLRDVEAAAKRAVQEAMAPLLEAKKETAKAKPKAAPKPEPEPTPATGNRLRAILWGTE
jgi:hypothetical protein